MNPEQIAILQELKQLMEQAIDSILEKYRIVYTLREVEGIPVQEISECLELSDSNVKVRLHRAKSLLKERLLRMTVNRDVFEFGNKQCDKIVKRVLKLSPPGKHV